MPLRIGCISLHQSQMLFEYVWSSVRPRDAQGRLGPSSLICKKNANKRIQSSFALAYIEPERLYIYDMYVMLFSDQMHGIRNKGAL